MIHSLYYFSHVYTEFINNLWSRMSNDEYKSPLSSRYVSPEMNANFGNNKKFGTWRRLWTWLADAQRELGLDISQAQITEMKHNWDTIDYEMAAREERARRHDVMAHVHTFAAAAPTAAPIIHLAWVEIYEHCLLRVPDPLGQKMSLKGNNKRR